MKKIPCTLTIAGTDPSGGAGIQADLKTFQELKSYGMSIITSVLSQNTTGVQSIHHVPTSMLESQIDSVIKDMPIHAFKSGMIAHVEMMRIIQTKMKNIEAHYVIDPVMVATSGDRLIDEEATQFLRSSLIKMSTVVTPNIPEAEFLLERKIRTAKDMEKAAKDMVHLLGAKAAIVKGGHMINEDFAIDYFYDGNTIQLIKGEKIDTQNTHGTGCTLSAAITAYLSQGYKVIDAVKLAKKYVTLAIKHGFDLGNGSGPTNHFAPRYETFRVEV